MRKGAEAWAWLVQGLHHQRGCSLQLWPQGQMPHSLPAARSFTHALTHYLTPQTLTETGWSPRIPAMSPCPQSLVTWFPTGPQCCDQQLKVAGDRVREASLQ